jgi:hypothetical protein
MLMTVVMTMGGDLTSPSMQYSELNRSSHHGGDDDDDGRRLNVAFHAILPCIVVHTMLMTVVMMMTMGGD